MANDYQIIEEMFAILKQEEMMAWLEDGEALAAAGVLDQEAVEEAWYMARESASK